MPMPDKSLLKRFFEKAAGLSWAQVTRLAAQRRRTGRIRDRRRKPPANALDRRLAGFDAAPPAEVDERRLGWSIFLDHRSDSRGGGSGLVFRLVFKTSAPG